LRKVVVNGCGVPGFGFAENRGARCGGAGLCAHDATISYMLMGDRLTASCRRVRHHRFMVNYRRYRIPGTWVFFTQVLHDRSRPLLTEHIDLLREAYNTVHARWPFHTVAFVVLPDHLHCIWSLPGDDTDYPGRWRMIKSGFTRLLRLRGVQVGVRSHGERCVWQRRYWEHTLHTEDDLRAHVDYIHGNPLKHGWAERMADWPYSSFHAYASRGDERASR